MSAIYLSWRTFGGHLADRCGQLDIWRTLASLLDQYVKISKFLFYAIRKFIGCGVAILFKLGNGHVAG